MGDADDPLKEFETAFRLAALEIVVIDFLAAGCLVTNDPVAAAEARRERFKNLMVRNPYPDEKDSPGLSEILSGEVADAVDRLMENLVGTVRRRMGKRERER